MEKALYGVCKECKGGSCCSDGVDVGLMEASRISTLKLNIKKPWFRNLHKDKDFPSGWAVETIVRNGSCLFQKKDKKCTIYNDRPRYCAEFPFEDGKVSQAYKFLCCESEKIKMDIKEHKNKSNRKKVRG